ncbi:unnamed protein product [Rangifer tarandus platyrhynchus]|uniref:Uncharacterized protein n=1 Tax=Rangifer tarandus platyrhynchus TaxID=3082113 RepID=A0ACB1KHP9_RANTA
MSLYIEEKIKETNLLGMRIPSPTCAGQTICAARELQLGLQMPSAPSLTRLTLCPVFLPSEAVAPGHEEGQECTICHSCPEKLSEFVGNNRDTHKKYLHKIWPRVLPVSKT